MHAARGILTARGGMTSHAAVVARGMGRPCVSGAGMVKIDAAKGTMTAGGQTVMRGDIITLDGSTGQVFKGKVPMRQPELTGDFGTLMGWADSIRTLKVRMQCGHARGRGHRAQVRRRRHRAVPHRAHVLRCRTHRRGAPDDPGRRRSRSPRGAGQAVADAARRFRSHLHGDGRTAGHDPPARSAAARIPAQQRRRDCRSGEGGGRRSGEIAGARDQPARIQSHARSSRLPPRHHLSRDLRDAGARA